jgi:hypothetical protein
MVCDWAVHASRELARAPSLSRTFILFGATAKDCFGATLKVRGGLALARETCALPNRTSAGTRVLLREFPHNEVQKSQNVTVT